MLNPSVQRPIAVVVVDVVVPDDEPVGVGPLGRPRLQAPVVAGGVVVGELAVLQHAGPWPPRSTAWPPAIPSSPLWWMKLSRTIVPGPIRTPGAVVQASLDAGDQPAAARNDRTGPSRLPNFSTVRLRISTPAPPEIPSRATETSSFRPLGSSAR